MEGPLFELSGGALCLDFANTLGDRPRRTQEGLLSYDDLVRWAVQTGVVTAAAAKELVRHAQRSPLEGAAVVARAITLRESLYDTVSPLAAGVAPSAGVVARLGPYVADLLSRLRLSPRPGGLEWRLANPADSLDVMLPPIVRSALELLTGPESELVRECASASCSWLFVDRSRTHRRRWCNMKVCGNRAKARRFYARRRDGG